MKKEAVCKEDVLMKEPSPIQILATEVNPNASLAASDNEFAYAFYFPMHVPRGCSPLEYQSAVTWDKRSGRIMLSTSLSSSMRFLPWDEEEMQLFFHEVTSNARPYFERWGGEIIPFLVEEEKKLIAGHHVVIICSPTVEGHQLKRAFHLLNTCARLVLFYTKPIFDLVATARPLPDQDQQMRILEREVNRYTALRDAPTLLYH
jgi:hypothetical protein